VLEKPPDIPPSEDAVTQVRAKIAAHDYKVDAGLVAEEILRKIRLVKWARQELAPPTGRTPQPPAAH
jgi:hypothetical protein